MPGWLSLSSARDLCRVFSSHLVSTSTRISPVVLLGVPASNKDYDPEAQVESNGDQRDPMPVNAQAG